jgi:hypothetical protein
MEDDWVLDKPPYLYIVWRVQTFGRIGRLIHLKSNNPNDSRDLLRSNKDDVKLCELIKQKAITQKMLEPITYKSIKIRPKLIL